MNKEQFIRWENFSVRMAETCYPTITANRKSKIIQNVKDFFEERKRQNDFNQFSDWDGNGDSECLSEYVEDFYDNHRHWNRQEECYTGNFYNQITCCIRAGFDVAVHPSGGVLGFTAGDIRKMWDNKVPIWVKNVFEGKFDTFPDNDMVWL